MPPTFPTSTFGHYAHNKVFYKSTLPLTEMSLNYYMTKMSLNYHTTAMSPKTTYSPCVPFRERWPASNHEAATKTWWCWLATSSMCTYHPKLSAPFRGRWPTSSHVVAAMTWRHWIVMSPCTALPHLLVHPSQQWEGVWDFGDLHPWWPIVCIIWLSEHLKRHPYLLGITAMVTRFSDVCKPARLDLFSIVWNSISGILVCFVSLSIRFHLWLVTPATHTHTILQMMCTHQWYKLYMAT